MVYSHVPTFYKLQLLLQENKAKQEINKVVQANSNPVGVKIRCKKLTDKQNFKCRAADIYRALTEKDVS